MLSLNLVIGAGAIQGLLLATVLFVMAQTRSNPALRWLGGFVGAYSLLVISDVLLQTRAILEAPHLYQVFDFLIFWLGPLCFGYVRSLLGFTPWRWLKWWSHFLPGLLVQALVLSEAFISAAQKRELILSDLAAQPNSLSAVLIVAAGLYSLAYLLYALYLLRNYWRELETHYSNLEKYAYLWLTQLLGWCSVLWTIWMISVIASSHTADLIAQLGLAAGIYGLGYGGLRQPKLWSAVHTMRGVTADDLPSDTQTSTNKESETNSALPNRDTASTSARPKYTKTGLNPEQLAAIGMKVDQLMQNEMIFLEPNLSLADLAKISGVSPHTLSQTFSLHFHKNFFEYINSLRIKEVQRCFADPAFTDQSILEIALASGFSSKATFNATFKRLTGTTPSSSRATLKQTMNQINIRTQTK